MNLTQLAIIVCFCDAFMTTHNEPAEDKRNAIEMKLTIAWLISAGTWMRRIAWLSLSQVDKQLKNLGKYKTDLMAVQVSAPE